MRGRLMHVALGALALAGCAPAPPPTDKPFDVMTALQAANRTPPESEQIWPRTCRRITEKECW